MASQRKNQIILPRFQLRLAAKFVGLSLAALLCQFLFMGILLTNVLRGLPGAEVLIEEVPGIVLKTVLFMAVLQLPILSMGLILTFRIAGPVYRFESYLRALARQATGAIRLAEDEPRKALSALREAEDLWRRLEAPFEAARTRALAALACRDLGDETGAAMELEVAGGALRAIGAAPELARVDHLRRELAGPRAGKLTSRELDVLRLVAAGLTNRAIAGRLRISEKTVARHVSNIFLKLGLSNRSAATAYAYRHALVGPRLSP